MKPINLQKINEYSLEETIKSRFSWASDQEINDAIANAAILINSILTAIENEAHDAALLVMASGSLARKENLEKARQNGQEFEREICRLICRELADSRWESPCCISALLRLEKAIESRNNPS